MGFKIIKTPRSRKEYSKNVIDAMILLWFLTAAFGAVVVWLQGYGLEALLSFVGAPMTGGIIGYLVKSAIENREKIRYCTEEEYEASNALPQIGFDGSAEGGEHP